MRFIPLSAAAAMMVVAAPAFAVEPVDAGTVQAFNTSLSDYFAQRDGMRPEAKNLPAPVNGVVPEPATWAMLIAGFGLVGLAARRRRTARA